MTVEDAHKQHLRDLDIKFRAHKGGLSIRTPAGSHQLPLVYIQSARIPASTFDVVVGMLDEGSLLLSDYIRKGFADRLRDAGVNYLDAVGNCSLNLPGLRVHVEGKRARAKNAVVRALRAPSYQALFVYLAEPESINASLRTIAELAGVSTTAVSNMRSRLLRDGFTRKTKARLKWVPEREVDALALWLHGYATSVRPALLYGRYRIPKMTRGELHDKLLTLRPDLRWGGVTGGHVLNPYYQGKCTTIHVQEPLVLEETTQIPAGRVDDGGTLIVLGTFGLINATDADTPHPLLVYSEMLMENTDRAKDAAARLAEKML